MIYSILYSQYTLVYQIFICEVIHNLINFLFNSQAIAHLSLGRDVEGYGLLTNLIVGLSIRLLYYSNRYYII